MADVRAGAAVTEVVLTHPARGRAAGAACSPRAARLLPGPEVLRSAGSTLTAGSAELSFQHQADDNRYTATGYHKRP